MNTVANAAPERFSPRTLRRLFDAVEVNDVVEAGVALPDPIAPECSAREMRRCFALCVQFWQEEARPVDLFDLVWRLLRGDDLDADQRLRYKHIRARYKHLRSALALYGEDHHAPWTLDTTTACMGKLQDAFRNGRRGGALGYGLALRLLLTKPVRACVAHRIRVTRMDDAEGFLAYRRQEMVRIGQALARASLTGPEFHQVRKIVSRQVSFYDTLRSIEPTAHAYEMSRFLAAINGLMGARHDAMVEQAASGQRAYGTAAPIDGDIRQRLEALVAHYPLRQCNTSAPLSDSVI